MARAAAAGARSGRRPSGWVAGLLCGALLALATSLAMVLAILLLPGLLAQVLDRARGKPAARAMLLFGGCGCVGPLREVWAGSPSAGSATDAAWNVIASPDVLATAWLAAAGGWLLSELAPVLTGAALAAAEARRLDRLRAAKAEYEREWELALPADGGRQLARDGQAAS